MYDKSLLMTTAQFTTALRSYSPLSNNNNTNSSGSTARSLVTSAVVSAAQRRRAYITFIVSRERSKREAAQHGFRCYSLDSLEAPPSRGDVGPHLQRPHTSVTNNYKRYKPKFVFSHSSLGGGCNNSNSEQRERDCRTSSDYSASGLPLTNGAAATSGTGTVGGGRSNGYSVPATGFRPMNSRNNFLGGQQITPLATSQPRPGGGGGGGGGPHASSNTSSSYSK